MAVKFLLAAQAQFPIPYNVRYIVQCVAVEHQDIEQNSEICQFCQIVVLNIECNL